MICFLSKTMMMDTLHLFFMFSLLGNLVRFLQKQILYCHQHISQLEIVLTLPLPLSDIICSPLHTLTEWACCLYTFTIYNTTANLPKSTAIMSLYPSFWISWCPWPVCAEVWGKYACVCVQLDSPQDSGVFIEGEHIYSRNIEDLYTCIN